MVRCFAFFLTDFHLCSLLPFIFFTASAEFNVALGGLGGGHFFDFVACESIVSVTDKRLFHK